MSAVARSMKPTQPDARPDYVPAPSIVTVLAAQVTMIIAGSLQAPITPFAPTVRTRTQMVVPTLNPVRTAFPSLNTTPCPQFASTFGSSSQTCTSLVLRARYGRRRAVIFVLRGPWLRRRFSGAAGTPERPVVAALHAAQNALTITNPRQVRDFARGRGQRGKTDRIDVRMLAEFGAANTPPPTPAPSSSQAGLAAWVTRREQIQAMLCAERVRQIPGLPKAVAKNLDASIARLEKHLARIVAHLAAALAATPQIAAIAARLCAIQGVGPASPPLSSATCPNWARSAVGVSPHSPGSHPSTMTSVPRKGQRHSAGGRASVRGAL